MDWEIVIGLEIHVQLKTQSKIFSHSPTTFGTENNTQTSYIDAGFPGTLPSLNKKAVELAIRFGIATQAKINQRSTFARKNYFYPDLPKGYQITQDREPILSGGHIPIQHGKEMHMIRIDHAHLEEDAGRSLHENLNGYTGIDLNRAGIPLLEIVSLPMINSPIEAVCYAKAVHHLVQWLNICDGNMQNGSFRMDANISVRNPGETSLRTKCELKNLNSFRFLEKAIEYEVKRHIDTYERGGKITQETRLYDAEKNLTRSMRQKESAHDYRYFNDPDLPTLTIPETWIEDVKKYLPEMPWVVQETLSKKHGLSQEEAIFITQSLSHTKYFEIATSNKNVSAQQCINWMSGPLQAYINEHELSWEQPVIPADKLAQIIENINNSTLSQSSAKKLFQYAIDEKDQDVVNLIKKYQLAQITDLQPLTQAARAIILDNPEIAAQIKSGKDKAINALIGKMMKQFSGKINATQARELLLNAINEALDT
ncbi:Asp-tRNA(Asn)/Glu-tRNA(Gln) amidotransferase subunit GatB [Candidatus Ichthyocystis hellenicum]|uniref:Asp-tRNA(Asn)/Glu-tRNA(Gln) amidotransferase subunit GatB n=1 Tax=Candidatus Ichthyocystis hellenicum TaxID=1561003 RepID=UPI000A99BF4D|nr:Asp-tRNA(Asn)/Glu-tRNA(Gln) amidotransferase subunit GatB [Candidatus Ichthyocystis hellenicum]